MEKSRPNRPGSPVLTRGDSKSLTFHSVNNDAYHEDFLRRNGENNRPNYVKPTKSPLYPRSKTPIGEERGQPQPRPSYTVDEIRNKSSTHKPYRKSGQVATEESHLRSKHGGMYQPDNQPKDRISRLDLDKLNEQQSRAPLRFVADSFRGDMEQKISGRQNQSVGQNGRERSPRFEAGDQKVNLSQEFEDLMNQYQELLEIIIPQTLRPFLKSPTLFIDIVSIIFSTTNSFVDDKIKSTLADLARVLGIKSQHPTLLDILLKYPNGLNHLQPPEEDQILASIFRKVLSAIDSGKL